MPSERATGAAPPPTSASTNDRRRDPAEQQEVLRTVAERVGRASPMHSGTTARTEQIRTSLHETCPLSRTNPEWEDQCGNCLQEIGPHAARYRCSEECLDFTYCERCVFMWPLRTSVVESVEVDRNFPPLSTSHPPKPTSHPPMATSPPPTSFHHPLSRMTETPSAPPPPPPADFFAQLPPFQESILKEKAKTEESIAPRSNVLQQTRMYQRQMSLCRALRRHLLLCRLLGLVLVGSPDGQNSAKRNVRNVGRGCDDRKKVR